MALSQRLVCCSTLTVVIFGVALPNFARAGGDVPIEMLAAGLAASIVSMVAFIRCPRGERAAKVMTFVLVWPGVLLGWESALKIWSQYGSYHSGPVSWLVVATLISIQFFIVMKPARRRGGL